MALSKERGTRHREAQLLDYPVAAGVTIYKGALVALEDGYAVPGKTDTGLYAAGRAEESADNSAGSAGDLRIVARRGVFHFANSSTDPIAQADVGAVCYIEDDETVAKTNGTNTRSQAGVVRGVDASGVWLEI